MLIGVVAAVLMLADGLKALPNFSLPDDPAASAETRKYFRAEVHLSEGGQDYDLMGWSREEVIGDILDQYERHLHFLHLVR